MKLLSVQLAKTTWLMDLAETNPRGKNIFLDLIPALAKRFEFKTFPVPDGDFKEGMNFKLGTFKNSKGDYIQIGLTIWSDGIAADAFSTTADSDEFLEVVARLLPDLGYTYDPEMVRKTMHLSQLIVRSSMHLSGLNPRLREFSDSLAAVTGGEMAFDCAALEFWPDQTKSPRPANFSFQKRAGDSFTGDRYWSQAGLTTDKHLKVLDELEALLSGGPS